MRSFESTRSRSASSFPSAFRSSACSSSPSSASSTRDARARTALFENPSPSSLSHLRSASLAVRNASWSTSAPYVRAAPSRRDARSAAPPPTHGSIAASPGEMCAALAESTACSGGMAFGASTARRAARASRPHARTVPRIPSGWRYTIVSVVEDGSSGSSRAGSRSADGRRSRARAWSHAGSAATSRPTPASHSSAPTRSRATRGSPLRPGARTCAAHRAARAGPRAAATSAGEPTATGRSATRVSAHRRTAARADSSDGNGTSRSTDAGWVDPGVAGGTAWSVHAGVNPSRRDPRTIVPRRGHRRERGTELDQRHTPELLAHSPALEHHRHVHRPHPRPRGAARSGFGAAVSLLSAMTFSFRRRNEKRKNVVPHPPPKTRRERDRTRDGTVRRRRERRVITRATTTFDHGVAPTAPRESSLSSGGGGSSSPPRSVATLRLAALPRCAA